MVYMAREMVVMLKKRKAYFLAPLVVLLVLLAVLAFYVGPGAVVTFIYAGL